MYLCVCVCERARRQVCVHVFMCSSFVRLHLCVLFVWLGVISGSILITWIYFPQEHTSPGITIAMLPPADTFTWALPRRPSQPSSLWDTPASPLRRAWPPTCPRLTIRPSLPCPHPPSSRMCRGLHSYLRPYTSNTSSSSSFLKRSTAGSSRTPGKTSLHANTHTHTFCILIEPSQTYLCHSRRTQERIPLNPHRLRSGYEYSPPLHVPQPMTQQPRYLAEGTDWWVPAGDKQVWIISTHLSVTSPSHDSVDLAACLFALQGPECGRGPPSPPVPAPAAPSTLSALPGLPSHAPLPQEHILRTSGRWYSALL